MVENVRDRPLRTGGGLRGTNGEGSDNTVVRKLSDQSTAAIVEPDLHLRNPSGDNDLARTIMRQYHRCIIARNNGQRDKLPCRSRKAFAARTVWNVPAMC